MANSKPTHRVVYRTGTSGEGEEAKDHLAVVGAAWLTKGGAMYVKPSVPITLLPGDDNLMILPIKEDSTE